MSVTLLLSVVALVAGQPTFDLPPPPIQGVCSSVKGYSAQCCVPNGCDHAPGMPPSPWGAPLPPPYYLQQVCCQQGTTCCPVDFSQTMQPRYTCCSSSQTCSITSLKGTCVAQNSSITNGMTPGNVASNKLDPSGRCSDGSRPAESRPGVPYYCSLNILIPNRLICPIGMKCVKDLSPNTNAGVCCLDSHCGQRTTCADCVTANTTAPAPPAPGSLPPPQPVCSWLSQGDHYNPNPRCVQSCDNFPEKSCIPPNLVRECPYNATSGIGRKYNTGSCVRRCGLVGTGRSSRITNSGILPPNPGNINTTACCRSNGGDYCCDDWQGLARHCNLGYVPGGPQCGVPIRGTPNNFFNSPPYGIPPYYVNPNLPMPSPYMPPMYQAPWPQPYPFYRALEGDKSLDEVEEAVEEMKEVEADKQFFFPPMPMVPPPMYGPMYGPVWNPYMRPVYPSIPTTPLDQLPSAFICSCDKECGVHDDCCEDYTSNCIITTGAPTAAPTPATP